MRSQPSSVSSYRLPRFFEAAAFFVFIRVLHDEGTMTDSDQERNLTAAEQTIRRTGPRLADDHDVHGDIAASAATNRHPEVQVLCTLQFHRALVEHGAGGVAKERRFENSIDDR